jgi:ribosomal protein S18 acetylase RimI-like enzyme
VTPAAVLRPFAPADDEALIGWFKDVDALRRFGGPRLRWPLDRAQLDAVRRDPDMRAYTLWAGDPPGRAGHVELRRMSAAGVRLARVGIDPARRGRGLGRMLVAAALEEARRLGYTHVELGVYADNAVARALYANFGFEQMGPVDAEGTITMARDW